MVNLSVAKLNFSVKVLTSEMHRSTIKANRGKTQKLHRKNCRVPFDYSITFTCSWCMRALFINKCRYVESKPNYWNPKHSVIVKEIAELNKLKMCLSVQHTINHQNYGERSIRISELILELKKIFENLGIKYHLLPQEIHITQLNLDNWTMPSHT